MADKIGRGRNSRVFNEIKNKTKSCLESRKEANKIIDIISLSETEEKAVLLACVRSFHKIFVKFLSCGELYLDKMMPDPSNVSGLPKEEQYKLWLTKRYQEVVDRLTETISHEDASVQELSLCTLMKFVETEGQNPIRKISAHKSRFPRSMFEKIVKALINSETDRQALIGRFQEYMEYDDVRYHVMTALKADFKNQQNKTPSDVYLGNVFWVLNQIKFTSTDMNKPLTHLLIQHTDAEKCEETNVKEHRKVFTKLWRTYLQFRLPTSLYRKVLVILHDKVIPYMTTPMLLSDFLTESYNIGGAISLLALNGIFILVHRHNLDYPDFYGKLYRLFEPSVFHTKYRARFFYLADLFLTSTHIPAYLVAAFAKKLARISLTAPPSGLTVSIPFIYNLIGRHPNCKQLLHRPGASDVEDDPYDVDEADPAKCRAMESCLWELKTLQSHYHPDVSKAAKKMENQQLIGQQTDVSELFETSYDDLFDKETKKKMKFVPVNYDVPRGLLSGKDDRMKLCWQLQ